MNFLTKSVNMINKLRFVFIGAAIVVGLGFYEPAEADHKKDKVILNLVYQVLNSTHFSPQNIDNEFSEKVYTNFINDIDFNKRFLLAQDVEELNKHKLKIDDQIRKADLAFFNEAFDIYQKRLTQVEGFYKEILAEPFDFSTNETFETDDEKLDQAKSEAELKDRWRQYLKYRTLVRLEENLNDQEQDSAATDTTPVKSFTELETEAREKVQEMHEQWFDNLRDMERIDWVAAYMNTITNIYDPHTQYFPPERKEDFEISMTGQLQGIGAQLEQKGEYVTISKIIPGSACWKQGDLEVGDKILQVAQGDAEEDEEAVDMVGMKVRKAVNYIRGPKGTTVILTVRKVDGSKMEIPIVRDIVELESTFAKSAVLGEGEDKVGYIRLPKFYVNFYGEENHDCADDVKAELEKLKAENVNGVILDLRNNGGGSLQGVVDIVGLFIEEGPVVQVKAPGRSPAVLKDTDKKVVYNGPLVVMVNRFSASASEIFAAAIQDYGRGVIIGSESTFGKGTVQNIVDMDRAVSLAYNDVKPLGALKLTIQKYYRINGGTPQLRGVTPDIILPDNYMHIPFGEKEQDYALPYDEIGSADYEIWPKAVKDLDDLKRNSQSRLAQNEKFKLIEDYADWIKKEQDNTLVSLNLSEFKASQDTYREEAKRYKNVRKSLDELEVMANEADKVEIESSEENQKKADNWHKKLSTDLFLQEAVAVTEEISKNYSK